MGPNFAEALLHQGKVKDIHHIVARGAHVASIGLGIRADAGNSQANRIDTGNIVDVGWVLKHVF